MISYLDRIRPLLRYVALFSFFLNLLTLTSALFTLQIFDRVLPSQSVETLFMLCLGAVIALGTLFLLDCVRQRLQGIIGNLIDEYLAGPTMEALVYQIAREGTATRVDAPRDIAAVRNMFTASGVTALFDAPWILIFILVIFAFDPALGFGALIFSGLMVTLAWTNDRLLRGSLESLQQNSREATQFLDSSLRNAEVLQAMGMTASLVGRWEMRISVIAKMQWIAGRRSAVLNAATRSLRQLIQVAMIALGAYLVISQRASPGIMIATTIILGRALQPVEQLVASWRGLVQGYASYKRLHTLLDDRNAVPKGMQLPSPTGKLVLSNVSYRMPRSDRVILQNISLELLAGESLAIIGPSGAGKSTLARIMTGVWKPIQGRVALDDADLSKWNREDLGPSIGYAPQDSELFEGTVAENIARLGDVDSEKVVTAAKRAHCHTFCLSLPVGYDTPVGAQGCLLSPGQRQRIALARALYGSPRILVLDEPNANLDSEGESALAHALAGLHADKVSCIVVTHRPALIAHVDKILLMDRGRVHQFGPAGEVRKWMQQRSQSMLSARNKAV